MTRALLAMFLAGLLGACGGGGDTPAASAPPGATAPVAPPVVTPPVITPPVVTPPVTPPVTPAVETPAPEYAIPAGLWTAPSGATPASGNYIYLQSSYGDFVGGGRVYTYTNADALITITSMGSSITAGVTGNQDWRGYFRLPYGIDRLQPGYFKDLTGAALNGAHGGGISWGGDGRGCNDPKGWVVIDKIVQTYGVLESLDLRFQQSCNGNAPLNGQIHWNKDNVDKGKPTTVPSAPATLWRAPANAVPASGNYVHLQSTSGDFIGMGATYSYNPSNATIKLNMSGATLSVNVAGNESWFGDFQGVQGMSQLEVGYYGGLTRYPFNNPVLGGMSWWGEGRGCNTLTAWFVVDKAIYLGGRLEELDLRFEQHCEGDSSALRGQVHWSAADTTTSTGPKNPPPAGLWKPDANFIAPSGNYVYLVSDAGDFIGQGRTELLTSANNMHVATNRTAAVGVSAGAWSGDFLAMNSLSQLQPGYYGDLQRYPFHNAAKGGLSWTGEGRACNILTGWFVVDKVSYTQGQLSAIDLRFEQHCEGMHAAQRGAIHWVM